MHTWSTQKGGGRPTAGQSLPWLPEELREVCAAGVSRVEKQAGVRWCWRTKGLGFGILSKDHRDLVFDSKGLGQLLKRFEADCWAAGGEGRGQWGGCCSPTGQGGWQGEQGWRQPGYREADVAKIGLGGEVSRTRRLTECGGWGGRRSQGLWLEWGFDNGNRNGQQKQKQIWVQGLTEWWIAFQGCWHRSGCVQPVLGLYGSGRRSWATEFLWL